MFASKSNGRLADRAAEGHAETAVSAAAFRAVGLALCALALAAVFGWSARAGVSAAYAVENADYETVAEAELGPAQLYDGKLYIGDIRTGGGPKTIVGIPGSTKPPISAERFLFSDGGYYYVENFPGNGTAPVKLHHIPARSDADAVISDDVESGTDVFFADGKVAFTSFAGKGSVVTVVDVAAGTTQSIDFGSDQGIPRLIGYHRGSAYVVCGKYGSDTVVCKRAPGDWQSTEVMRFDADTKVAGLYDGAIVTVKGTAITAYDESGGHRWQCTAQQEPQFGRMSYHNGYLCFDAGTATGGASRVVGRIKMSDGTLVEASTGLPVVLGTVYADADNVYFCGLHDDSAQSQMSGSFETFVYSVSTKKVSNVNSAQAGASSSVSTSNQGSATSLWPSFDAHNISDYHDINLFLSNFAELSEFWWNGPYDGAYPDKNKVVSWGFWHYVLNNDTLVTEEVELPGTTNGFKYKRYGESGGSWYSRYTDTAGVENAIRRYLGLDYDLSGYRGGTFAESNGRIYDSSMRGSATPRGLVALADSSRDIGEGNVQVDFTIYPISMEMITDDSWYTSMPTIAKIEAEKNTFGDIVTAHAVVSVEGKLGDRTFVLRSLKVDR